jgi:hypothetical protein
MVAAQFIALISLAALHIAAIIFALYWHYVWLDVVTHFLGGVWVALAVQLARAWMGQPLLNSVWVLVMVLIVGIAWELFELLTGIPRENNYMFDTSIDLVMDSLGALVGYAVSRGIERTAA